MRTKVFLILSVCCFLISLGLMIGLATAPRLLAEGIGPFARAAGNVFDVRLVEDFMREHGRNVHSICVNAPSNEWFLVGEVPEGKRFIVTDIFRDGYYSSGPARLYLSSAAEYAGTKLGYQGTNEANLNSGVTFEPGESIYVYSTIYTLFVTISGYYVDL